MIKTFPKQGYSAVVFNATFYRNGKPELISNVVVGKAMNKTVIFSADMKYIVFSPYWNLPTSIVRIQ